MNRNSWGRVLALGLVLLLALSFAGCEKPSDEQSNSLFNNTESTVTGSTDEGYSQPTDGTSDRQTDVSDGTGDSTDGTGGSTDGTGDNTDKTTQSTDTTPANSATSSKTESSSTQTSNTSTPSTTDTPTPPAESTGTGTETDSDDVEEAPAPVEPPKTEPPIVVGFTPVSPADYYGRTWLKGQPNGTALVKAYDRIVTGITAMQAEISLKDSSAPISAEELKIVWNCYCADYPQHFWINSAYSYGYSGSEVISVSPQYNLTPAQKQTYEERFEKAAEEMLKNLNGSMSQFDLEKAIHDRLVLACTYNNSSFCHTAYGALVEHVAVCDGFARAFQYLCRAVGIETMLVAGESTNPANGVPEGHAWNVVKIDGQHYHVDVTWDNAGEPSEKNVHYAYFNLTTAQIQKDHTIKQEGYTIPTCTATAANYFVKHNAVFTELSVANVVSCAEKKSWGYVSRFRLESSEHVVNWLNNHSTDLVQGLQISQSVWVEVKLLSNEVIILFIY